MKTRLQKLIRLGIITVLTVSTVVFTSQDSISGVVTIAAETESETETETEESPAEESKDGTAEEEPAPEEPAAEESVVEEESAAGEPVVEEEPAAGESVVEKESAAGEPVVQEEAVPEESAVQEEAVSRESAVQEESMPEESVPEETVPDEEFFEEDAGIVSSDWETLTADAGAVGDEIILDVDNDENGSGTGEPLVAAPAEKAMDTAEKPAETASEKDKAAEEKAKTDEGDGVAANIIGFSVDPSKYPPADASENTRYIYNYLTKTMGFNHAAACGILANIHMESAFNPLALGDGGTSYGLCQWHNERFNSLISYCNSVGLDYNTLDGQLANLNRELTGAYSSIYSYIMSVPDTAQGAYDAGYYWCVYYEIPNNATSHGALRGNLASNEYYPLDLSMDDSEEMPVEDSIFRLREDMALQSDAWAVNTEEDGSVIFTFPEVVLVKKTE